MANKFSITTKRGDKGKTRLFSGEEVSKYSPRLEAYGDLDELVSMLGVARLHVRKEEIKDAILFVQRSLFVAGSELATTKEKLQKLTKRVDGEMLKLLDAKRDALEEVTPIPRGFVVPGGSLASAHLDHARTVARRCERKIVKLFEDKQIENEMLIVWFNRLSDYLYLMARFEEGKPILVKE